MLSNQRARPLFDTGVRSLGYNRLEGRMEGGSTCSETHLLHATVQGELVCEAGDEPLTIPEGRMLIAPARGPHWVRMTRSPTTAAWLHISQTPRWEFLLASGRRVHQLHNPIEFAQAVESIVRASRDGHPRGSELMYHYAEVLLVLLSEELDPMRSPADHQAQSRLLQLWEAVRDDPTHDWSVQEMAGRVRVSPGYLPGVCKRLFGVTPMQKVAIIRMEQAQDLLRLTNLTFGEIADRVGYANQYAFSDAFKRVTGVRPGAFRRNSSQGR